MEGAYVKNGRIILSGKNLSKEFHGNVVLEDVSITCTEGSAIALVGENGAGKSTLMNIISGGLAPSSGTIELDGRETIFHSSVDAREKGIAFAHQELSLMNEMTVGENIMLGREPRKGIWIDQKKLHEQAEEILQEIGYEMDVYAMVCDLSPAECQITEIAKAWSSNPRIFILDEPTSSLNKEESKILFGFIRKILEKNISVIMISHRMEDIYQTCDQVIVLKDGRFVFESPISETTEELLISKMVGRDFKNVYPERRKEKADKVKVSIRNGAVGSYVRGINIDVPEGTIVGIGGLEGQGQRELSRALFGLSRFTDGDYFIDGKKVKIHSPADAIRHKISFVPEDRKSEGLCLALSVKENILSMVLKKNSRFGFVDKKKEDTEAEEGIRQLGIKVSHPKMKVSRLSGGNQQKIVFSKWIKTNPEILYLNEPTRGVDVQSKLEIYALIRELTQTGVSVVIFTSDMMELIGLSDEIYIMYEGRISGHISGAEATEERIMQFSAKSPRIETEEEGSESV